MKIRELAIVVHYVHIIQFMKSFAIEKNLNEEQYIVVGNKLLAYVIVFVNVIISVTCFYTSYLITMTGADLADQMYRIPFYAVGMINGIIVSILLITKAKYTIQYFDNLRIIDQKLAENFSIYTDYKFFAIFVCTVMFLGVNCIISYVFLNYNKGFLLFIFMHGSSLSLGLAQTCTPLLYIQFLALYGAIKCKSMVNAIIEISTKESRKYIIIEKLNYLMKINFSIVQSVNFSNQICRHNLATASYLIFYGVYLIVVTFNSVGLGRLKELIAAILIMCTVYGGVIFVYSKFLLHQREMARALIEFKNPRKDRDIDLVRMIYLQMLLHHRIDITAYGMFPVYPGLILKVLRTLSTVTMFTFTILPELLN